MKSKGRDPRSREAVKAVYRRIGNMTGEELEYWIDTLSRPPEGVEATWRNRDLAQANGSHLSTPSQDEAETDEKQPVPRELAPGTDAAPAHRRP